MRPGAIAPSPGREAALAWASLAQRFPASSVLTREGAGCGSVGDVPGAWLASAPLSPSLWQPPPLYSHLRIPEAGSCQVASVVSDSVRPHRRQPTRLLCLWDSPGKNTGVGSHSFLQGIFLTQGSKSGLLHCRQILYHLSHQGYMWTDFFLLNKACKASNA